MDGCEGRKGGREGAERVRSQMQCVYIWDFPKIRVPYFGGPYTIPRILPFRVVYSGSPIFGNPHKPAD